MTNFREEFIKYILGTGLSMALGGFINSAQTPPTINVNSPRPDYNLGERLTRMVERNPQLIISPFMEGSSFICGKVFRRPNVANVESHPIPVDQDGNDLVGPQAHVSNSNNRTNRKMETFLNIFTCTAAVTTFGVVIGHVLSQKSIHNNITIPQNTTPEFVPSEILQDSEILNKAVTIVGKQIIILIPYLALGISFTYIGYYIYNNHHKTQIKKEELILRNLQRINTKLNLLPENKEEEKK